MADRLLTTAVRVHDKVWYWSAALDRAAIAERRMERAVRGGINFVVMIAALAGVLQFVWFVAGHPEAAFRSAFWLSEGRGVTILFLLSLWLAGYVAYRLIKEGSASALVERRGYNEALDHDEPVSLSLEEFEQVPANDRIDIFRSYAPEAMRAVEEAVSVAHTFGHGQISPLHLFAGLISRPSIGLLLARLDVSVEALTEKMKQGLAAEAGVHGLVEVTPEAVSALFRGYTEAHVARQSRVRPTELLLAIVRQPGPVQNICFDVGADIEKIENVVAWIRVMTELKERWVSGRARAKRRPKGGMDRLMTALSTPMLDRFADDLTEFAKNGALPPFVEREQLLEQVFRTLHGGRRHVLLVGEHGTGKEAVLYGIAQRMVEDDVPPSLMDRRLLMVSIPKLVAGATPAEVIERAQMLMTEAARSGNVVLAFPHIDGLVGITAGGSGGLDIGTALVDILQRSRLLSIATTTPQDDAASLERSILGQAFERVSVTEPSANEAIRILEAKAAGIERTAHVSFSYDALAAAVELSDRHMHDRALPEKAIEVAREAAQVAVSTRGERQTVRREDVAAVIAQKSGVPVTAVTTEESQKLLNFEDVVHERMVGQDQAVAAVSRAIRRARAELRNERRPIAAFLFLGPTGVGKTELAKTVAEAYFGAEDRMIRLDMSEYQDPQSTRRLVGTPGTGDGGLLTEAVRRQPFALLLLDEIEKAHPDILNIFLQVLDDGRLTDAGGRTVDFTNTIIIATSNAGSAFIQNALAQQTPIEQIQDSLLREQLHDTFRPEFLNRFDAAIVFRPLNSTELQEIARRMLIAVAKQLSAKGITLQVTEGAVAELATAGWDPQFGARPLRRIIQERVQDALAEFLLRNELGRRDVVQLDVGGRITVQKPDGV